MQLDSVIVSVDMKMMITKNNSIWAVFTKKTKVCFCKGTSRSLGLSSKCGAVGSFDYQTKTKKKDKHITNVAVV